MAAPIDAAATPPRTPLLSLDEIAHQPRAISSLRALIANNKIAHAYLFMGPEHAGKSSTALAFAAAVNCESFPGIGCGSRDKICSSCNKIATEQHPDVVRLKEVGAQKIIPISAIREQVISRLGSLPHEAKYRFFIFDEAAALPGPAANALLKSLEEPPTRTVFILCTKAPSSLLATIRSRCLPILFAPSSSPKSEPRRSEDSPQGAEDFTPVESPAEIEKKIENGRPGEILALAQKLCADKANIRRELGGIAANFHHKALKAAQTGRLTEAARFAKAAGRAVETENSIAKHNAHGQLAIEALLFDLCRLLSDGRRETLRTSGGR